MQTLASQIKQENGIHSVHYCYTFVITLSGGKTSFGRSLDIYDHQKKSMKVLALLLCFGAFFTSCNKSTHSNSTISQKRIIYLQTNDAAGNAILAYVQQPDMSLVPLMGSPFPTGGKGLANPAQALGPDDADNEVKITADGKFLLSVNAGSRSIAVLSIAGDGSLSAVNGSPFNSEGPNPESIDIRNQYVYVVNKGTADLNASGNEPNYTVMRLDADGKLMPLDHSTIKTSLGASPSQALLSNDGHFLFGADFLGFMLMPARGTLRSFTVAADGRLSVVAGSPVIIPGMGGALGLWQHPAANILYVGFPLQAKVAVYTIELTGALTLSKTLDAGLAACWLRTSKDGKYLYALNSGENNISIFNTSDPASPVAVEKFTLKNSGPQYTGMGLTFTTSEDFSFSFSADGKFCYVISQHTNTDFTIGNFNYLHVLPVAIDGTLSEPGEPLQIPVAATVRPQGVVSFDTY